MPTIIRTIVLKTTIMSSLQMVPMLQLLDADAAAAASADVDSTADATYHTFDASAGRTEIEIATTAAVVMTARA